MRPPWHIAVARSNVLERLAAFDPHVAGTPPLGLDLPGSDIDILCHATDLDGFAAELRRAFEDRPSFTLRRWNDGSAVIAGFTAQGWDFEIFGQTIPVAEQNGWRHFEIERCLLVLGGAPFREAVMRERRAGLKTEPAFAGILRLAGDPYAALLAIEGEEPAALTAAGFAVHGSA